MYTRRLSFLLASLVMLFAVTLGVNVIAQETPPDPNTRTDHAGALQVLEVLPAPDSQDIAGDAVVTVIFDRPVVPLTLVSDNTDLPDPLRFEPAINGTGEWLNTAIYTFRPEVGWAPGVSYTVTVDAGFSAVDGATLADPVRWTFTTTPPRLLSVNPIAEAGPIRLDPRIQATFNVALDRASLEEHFYMRQPGMTESVSGTFEWSDDSTGFSFEPDALLQLNTEYEIGYPGGSVRDATGFTLLPAETWIAYTVPPPTIVGTSPDDGAVEVSAYGGITLYFASPMDVASIEENIVIDPAPWRDPEYFYDDFNDSVFISYPREPSTTYTITIEPGLADVYGNTIDTPFTFTFSTTAYEAQVNLEVPGDVGFYNANAEATQLFVSHRNVSRLDMELYNVSFEEFQQAVVGGNFYSPLQDYQPAPDSLIQAWSMASVAPLNALRYDLLNLGQNMVDCPQAMETRLNIGDTAIVTSDPDPVRARSAPVDGEIVDLLYRDYVLPVVGGPFCGGDILWWEVRLRDETTAWVAEGLADEYFIDLQVAGTETPVTVTDANGDTLAPGIYMLSVTAPEMEQRQARPRRTLMIVGTANLTMKTTLDETLVWATDVNSGLPIPDAPISIYQESGVVAEGITDADGLLRLDLPPSFDFFSTRRMAVLQTDTHYGLGTTTWSDGIDPWRFGMNNNYNPVNYSTYVYTDRPVYRPGQPVYFRGVVRAKDDVTYTRTDLSEVDVWIYDDQNETIYQRRLPLNEFGTFSDSFDLADDTLLGFYRMEVYPIGVSEGDQNSSRGTLFFNVAEYRLPEFQVDLIPEREAVTQGEMISVTVDSTYFFGGNVTDAAVEYNVVTEPYTFEYEGPGGRFDFADFNPDGGPGAFYGSSAGRIASGEGRTDENGQFLIELPAEIENATQSQRFTIEATVRDESDQTVAGRTSVIVHQGELYLGARPRSYIGTAGEDAIWEFISVDWESRPVPNQDINVEIVERRWSSVMEQDPTGRTVWTWQVEEIPVGGRGVTTSENGRMDYLFVPENGGVYKATITTMDDAGNEVRASSTMWVSSRGYVSWRQQNSNRIDLVSDANDYSVGDTAEILITSPFQGVHEALVTVERDGVLLVDQITMESNSTVYELPITAEHAPNIFVSVMLIKGVDETNPVAAFRMGMIQLGVDAEQKEILIDIQPDRQPVGPGDTVSYTVRTTDYAGNPISAEVGVGLTDLASLSIGSPNSEPLMRFFYGQQVISVQTSTPLTINTDQLTQVVLDTIKGGGGGFGEGGIFDIREEFVDTAYWNASVVTDERGETKFEVTLPDNLTTWRLDARAVTRGVGQTTLVGQDTFDLLSTKPLLIRPITPRFFTVGDQLNLLAVVNNNTESEQNVDVFIEGSGLAFADDLLLQNFTIPAGGSQRVIWPVTVQDVPDIDLTFFAQTQNGEFNDASKPPLGRGDERLLPVYRYEATEIVGTGGVLRFDETSTTESVLLPESMNITQGELRVNLEPSLAATALEGLEYLETYRNLGVEATVSSFLPNVMTFRALDNLGYADPALRTEVENRVNFAVQRLNAWQKVDGGWGWYVRDESNPLVTAYALIGLAEAHDSGFAVDEAMIRDAQNFLRGEYIAPNDISPNQDWQFDRQVFVLYAMARSGAPDAARTSVFYDFRDRLSLYSQALLATTLDIAGENTDRVTTLLSDLRNAAIVSANGTHWEEDERDYFNWNTNTRTTAMILATLVRLQPESELIPPVVRWLMVARTADAWETTQETAWAVMALTDWMVASGELDANYAYSLTVNQNEIGAGMAQPETITETRELQVAVANLLAENSVVIERSDGPGNLYYTAYLRTLLPVPQIEAINEGVIIQRRYTLLDDPDNATITEAPIGELVQVRLTIIAPNDLNYLVVEDPIPAGTDAVDPGLLTSQQIGARPGLDTDSPLRFGWGWWWFSDTEFRDEKVVLTSTYLPAGTYEYVYTIRPGLEGTYNVIPPTAREFYFPDVFGRGAGSTFTVLPAED